MLGKLHAQGVDFSAEIAGDAPDLAFLAQLQEQVRANDMAEKVKFTGFLDRLRAVGAERLLRLAGDAALMQRLQRSGQARATVFSVDGAVCRIEQLAEEMQAALAAPQPIAEVA